MTALLMMIVPSVAVLALAVDVAALAAWLTEKMRASE
jgi:hypothetical protein